MTGRTTPPGTVDVREAGHMARMREWAALPSEEFAAQGLTRTPIPRGQMLVRPTVGVLRVGGSVLLVYGAYKTGSRLREAWGTPEFAAVAGEEAGAWTGGIVGSAIGAAAVAGVVCAPAGPLDLVCIAGGFLGGLVVGAIGSYVGAPIGRAIGAFPQYVYTNVVGGFVAIDLDPLLAEMRAAVAEINRWYPGVQDAFIRFPIDPFDPGMDAAVADMKRALRPLHGAVYAADGTLVTAARRIDAIEVRLRGGGRPIQDFELMKETLEQGRYYSSDPDKLRLLATSMMSAAETLKATILKLLPQRAAIIDEQSHYVMKK